MNEEQIRAQIEEYRNLLTGDIFADGEIQQKIYELKKQLNPRIEEHPEEDDDEGCLNCGS
jgi:hypothetical protein